ncbi:SpoIIE family protein phosphatase [Streptomyces sp. HYC2]|uniref:SpoIIE family protein phosphatase n=1 Tax=Streptomyces sp. HYC2 TaxID=2955207 RepID=UPI002480FFD2|nr:SpoIIE family protein phosphatase [Streptomyces sp. HYC2]
MRSLFKPRTVAGQVFLLQVVIAVLIVAAALVALVLQAGDDSTKDARERSLGIAETLAYAPDTLKAMTGPNPSKVLQPVAHKIMKETDVDLVVIYSKDGIRYTHPNPAFIGKPVFGARKPPSSPVTQTLQTTQGRSVVSYVPVTKPGGGAVGTVAVAITVQKVQTTAGRQLPVLLGTAAGALVLAAAGTALVSRRLLRQTHGLGPAEMTRMYDHHDAVLHAVREGVLIVGGDGQLLLANDEALRLLDLPPDVEGHKVTDLPLDAGIAELLTSERTASDEVHLTADRLLAVNKRPTAPYGGYEGSVVTLRDTTELRALSGRAEVARERLKLLYDAGMEIGTTLDVSRTAQELADVAVPRFADVVTVELVEEVLRGQEPTAAISGEVRRAAVRGRPGYQPLVDVGRRLSFAPGSPQARCVESGRGALETELTEAREWQVADPDRARSILERGIHSLIAVPLRARGTVLGVVDFWRCREEAFDAEDVPFAEELAARAAVALDNARRYTREHTMAVTLQRSLLPRGLPEYSALEVAYRYLPAQAGVGGDWFDVIELSGARVALVVGDVVGHGLHAAATMGRLRTAVHNFSSLDLAPDELLARLDDLVARLDRDGAATGGEEGLAGATCLYAVYDPSSGTCSLARAGHPPPALVGPDGSVAFPDLPAGPPLGLGGLPFEATELRLPEGSQLVLYTDGLVEDRERDIGDGIELLRSALAHPDRPPEQTCRAVLDALPPDHAIDDIALLVARTRVLDPDLVADWDVPADPAAVSRVRADVARQLKDWGLEDASFTTELLLSELVTNAIRYGSAPIHVRLLRDRKLICEVSDGSSTSPHLRYAATTDEGGRGLFLVARYAERWGTRYTPTGKVIWTEQPLHGGAGPAEGPGDDELLDQWDDGTL